MADNQEIAVVLKLVADQFQQELKNSQGALRGFNDFIKDWKTQLTAAGTAFFAIAKSTANFGEEALKTSQKTGMTVETLTALSYAAKLADVEHVTLTKGIKGLSDNMVDATKAGSDSEALFRRLGVSAATSAGELRPTESVLLDLAEVFAKSADGAGKTEAAVKLFGRAGVELIPFLNQGRTGISALMAEAQRLGVVLSKEDAEAANAFNDELKKLEAASRGLSLQLGKELVPGFTQLLEAFKNLTAGPVGAIFKLEIQGWASIFTLLNHAIKETGMEIEVFTNKIGKSAAVKQFWNETLRDSLKQLDANTRSKLDTIFAPEKPAGPSTQPSGTTDGKAPIPLAPDLKYLSQVLEAQRAMRDQAANADQQHTLNQLSRFRAYIDQRTALQEISQERAAELTAQADAAEAAVTEAHYGRLLASTQTYYAKRLKQPMDPKTRGLVEGERDLAIGKLQIDLSKAKVESELKGQADILNSQLAIAASREQERTDLVSLRSAYLKYYEAVGAEPGPLLEARLSLVRAELSQELKTTEEMASAMLQAYKDGDAERLRSLKATVQASSQLTDTAITAALERGKTRTVEATQAERQQTLTVLGDNLKAWRDYGEQVGATQQSMRENDTRLLEVEIAKRTNLEEASAARLLLAWRNKDQDLANDILSRTKLTAQQRETLEVQSLARYDAISKQYSDDIVAGWADGMRRYMRDTQSGFGMAADMARQTAQAMTQAFRTFFFDLFEGKVKSLKDVLRSVLDFAKQIIAQITAQLATKAIFDLVASVSRWGGFGGGDGFGSNASTGGAGIGYEMEHDGGLISPRRFAYGGVVPWSNHDSVPALLTPGEFVVSRQGVQTLERLNAGTLAASSESNVTVNLVNSGQTDKPNVNVRKTMEGLVLDIIFRDVQSNGPLRTLLRGA